jgi:DNA-binding response OmpR family regulator
MALGRKRDVVWDGTERRSPATVLVVNDDPSACELIARMIATAHYRTVTATNENEATATMASELPRCVVLDLSSGGVGSSLKVLDHIRSHDDDRINTARVVLCAPTAKNRAFSFQSGADAFLVRPFHIDELTAQIDDVLGRPQEERARHRRDELSKHDGPGARYSLSKFSQ